MALDESTRGWVTWRSAVIGSVGAAGICGLVPYNDYVVANTYMVGTYMPPVFVLIVLGLVVGNGGLNRWRPSWVLSRGELGTILAMLLAACAIPSQGFMRSFLPNMVWPFHYGQSNPLWWKAFSEMKLPGGLFPAGRSGGDPSSVISQYFYDGIPSYTKMSTPYREWIGPIMAWGIFSAAMLTTLVALAVLVLPQWASNERLSFPLAQVQIGLIEPPKKGKFFNSILGSPLFWIAVSGVCFVQGTVGLHQYFPKVPAIPIGYDVGPLFSEPWSAASLYVKKNTIYFSFVGVTYFIQARMAFSLWAIYVAEQLLNIWLHHYNIEAVARGSSDQQLGAAVAYVLGALWIGRRHWALVLGSTFGGRRVPADLQRFAPARVALIVAVAGIATMALWLMFMGVSIGTAGMIIAMILVVHAATARVVCETGLPCYRVQVTTMQICHALPVGVFSIKDVYFTGVCDALGPFTSRESAMTFSLLGMRDNDTSAMPARQGRGVLAMMVWAMLLGCLASGWSSLHAYYSHGRPLSTTMTIQRINPYALDEQPKAYVINPVLDKASGRWPEVAYNPWVHFGAGAAITGGLQWASSTWSGWPLMPVGFVASRSIYMDMAWISVLIGWLVKVMIMRFGGTTMYMKLRPLFIGLICGECVSTGIWLVINLSLAAAGHDYKYVNFLPD